MGQTEELIMLLESMTPEELGLTCHLVERELGLRLDEPPAVVRES